LRHGSVAFPPLPHSETTTYQMMTRGAGGYVIVSLDDRNKIL
jgi:hypothetical protein